MLKTYEMLEQKIKDQQATLAVVGLGYVGLPLSLVFLKAGFQVVGIDINPKKIAHISQGKSDITDISNAQVAEAIHSGRFKATADYAALATVDVAVICVPTPLNKTKDPDVSYILSAVEGVKKFLKPGQLIVLESTTYPGTTEELILPMLEETGLKVGQDFFLAFSPERVDPGNQNFATHNTPKIVGGITHNCTVIAQLFYEQSIEKVIAVSTSRAAEMVKLLENTFRSVNIGLVNEIALMCDRLKIDVWEVIDAAATKPFGFMPFYPGPGLGGHCIPIDPFYLSWKLKTLNYFARFIELAGDINSNMPLYVVHRVSDMLNEHTKPIKGSRILVLGVAYKSDINDYRESPALDIINLLLEKGAAVAYNDPYVPTLKLENGHELLSTSLSEEDLKSFDCLIVTTAHSSYDKEVIARHARLIFDARNAFKNIAENRQKIYKL